MNDVTKNLLDALKACRDRFAFYVEHHQAKGDRAKAAENEMFVAMADNAITGAMATISQQDVQIAKLEAECNSLSVRLDELENQEPVGIVIHTDVRPGKDGMYRHDVLSEMRLSDQTELYARPVPAEQSVPNGYCIAPSTRGYARVGAGRYVLQPCLADVDGAEVPSLVIRLATEDECNRRTVGDLEETPEEEVGVPMDENLIVCQLDFVSDMGLHALQQQLRLLRLEHFPGTSDKEHKPLNPLQAPAQPVNARLLEAAKGVISWTNAGDRPPVRDEIETGRMTGVRVHALADLFDAIVAADPSMKSKFDQNAMSSQSGFDFSSLLPDKQQPTVQTPSFKCGLCFDTGVLPKPMIAPEPPDTPCPNGCKASAERTTVRSKRRTEQTETPWPKES